MFAAHWFLLDEKVRFVIVGTFNMGLRYVIFTVLCLFFVADRYQQNLLATWALSSVAAFLAYKYLVFGTRGSHLREFAKSVLIWCLSYAVKAVLLWLLAGRLQWNVYLAQGVAIALLIVINYLLFKHFAFSAHEKTLLERLYNLWE